MLNYLNTHSLTSVDDELLKYTLPDLSGCWTSYIHSIEAVGMLKYNI